MDVSYLSRVNASGAASASTCSLCAVGTYSSIQGAVNVYHTRQCMIAVAGEKSLPSLARPVILYASTKCYYYYGLETTRA